MSNKEKLLAAAQKSLQKGQIPKAIKDYQKVVEADPKDMRNRQKLAELFSRDRRTEEAQTEYEAVAKYYTENGFYLKAIAVYKQMQKLEPERANIYHRLAELNEKQGLVGNALAEYRTLATYYEKNRMFPEAVNVLQKMRNLEPENLNIRVKIAEGYAQSGNMAQARKDFDDILADLRGKEEHARILKLYEILIPLFPADPEMKIGLAQALMERNDTEKGISLLRSLLKEDPENARVLSVLAQGYRRRDDFENERLTYHHLLKTTPDNLDLREAYINACLDGGENQRALEELEERKEAFFDGGRAAVLKTFYERLKPLVDDPQVMLTLQAIYEATGEGDKLLDVMSSLPGGDVCRGSREKRPVPEAVLDASLLDEAVEDLEELEEIPEFDPAAESGENIIEPPSALEMTLDGLEEIPLEFLEDVAEPAVKSQPASDPGNGEELELSSGLEEDYLAVEDVELELELLEVPVVEEFAEDPQEIALELEIVEPEIEALIEDEEPVFELQLDETNLDPELSLDDLEEEVTLEIEVEDEVPLEIVLDEEEMVIEELAAAPGEIGETDDFLTLDISAAPSGSAVPDLRTELEEAEFYLQQGLLDDAERVCHGLLEVYPGSDEVVAKLGEITARRSEEPAEETYFDLAGEIHAEGTPGFGLDDDDDDETDRFGLDGVLSEFKKGVESQIDADDAESHYNLGIAYKEMGLLDDAVKEFENAMRNPLRTLDCLTLKGLCLIEKGDFGSAEVVFQSAMSGQDLSEEERMGLSFEMGLLYEAWGRPDQALVQFQIVEAADRSFRDVGEKILSLQQRSGGVGTEEAKGQRERVSFV